MSFRDEPRLRCLHVQPAPTAVPRAEDRWAHQPRLRRLILRRLILRRLILRRLMPRLRVNCGDFSRRAVVDLRGRDHLMPRLRVNCGDFSRRAVVELPVRRQPPHLQEGAVLTATALRAGCATTAGRLVGNGFGVHVHSHTPPIATIHPP
jgi:hypothetical protein